MSESTLKSSAEQFLTFNDKSKSPYHATAALASMLRQSGFKAISESEDWSKTISEAGKFFFTREGSSIVAFDIPPPYKSSAHPSGLKSSFCIVGAHTDSPCFKVKPISTIIAHGYLQLGVECYGGGLWHTWFDRDLTVAGRVVVRNLNDDTLHFRLVSIKKPILRIPNLAIHLSRNVNVEGFKLNKETDTTPILATSLAMAINASANGETRIPNKNKTGTSISDRQPGLLLKLLADELHVHPKQIVDLDLCVSDTQPAAIGGALDEFVLAPRLDNLVSCFTATRSLISTADDRPPISHCINMVCCFDHEEVGSSSSHGAASTLAAETMRRITDVFKLDYHASIRRSLLISADMAHAIHPNYTSKHEANHRPQLGAGLVIKTNQNQRYATSGITGLIIREAARRDGIDDLQEFVVPNDKPCGSTIGPIMSSRTGLRTVDVGQPQLSMHSIREMCSVHDFAKAESVFSAVFIHFTEIDNDLREIEIYE